MATVPEWRLAGDWFDICSCDIPCPCEFAQAPTNNACQGMLAWHVRHGHFGEVQLDDLNLLALAAFEGNVWAGEAAVAMGLFIDESADGQQRDALQRIFAGEAGGWPAQFAALVGEFRGIEFVPIAAGSAGPDAQSAGIRGWPRTNRHVGPLRRRAHGGIWLPMVGREPVEQAHPV